jgi:hypothetical protein
MPRRKLQLVDENTVEETKPTNDAILHVEIEINGNVEAYMVVVKDFCCQVVKPKQTPETILEAVLSGLEASFGKRTSIH